MAFLLWKAAVVGSGRPHQINLMSQPAFRATPETPGECALFCIMEVCLFIQLVCGGLQPCGHAHKAAAAGRFRGRPPLRKVDSDRVSNLEPAA